VYREWSTPTSISYLGLATLGLSEEGIAAEFFTTVLIRDPNHKAAGKELDRIKARLETLPGQQRSEVERRRDGDFEERTGCFLERFMKRN
jgi:hypothetical protein